MMFKKKKKVKEITQAKLWKKKQLKTVGRQGVVQNGSSVRDTVKDQVKRIWGLRLRSSHFI